MAAREGSTVDGSAQWENRGEAGEQDDVCRKGHQSNQEKHSSKTDNLLPRPGQLSSLVRFGFPHEHQDRKGYTT